MLVCLGGVGAARSYLKPWENGNPPAQVSLRVMTKSSSGLSVNVGSMGKSVNSLRPLTCRTSFQYLLFSPLFLYIIDMLGFVVVASLGWYSQSDTTHPF